MNRMENSLAVRRPLLPEQHEVILSRIPLIQESCSDLDITWFDVGTVACTLIERREYRDALAWPKGTLWKQDVDAVAHNIRSMLTETSTGNDPIEATVSDIDFTGRGRHLHITYMLNSAELMEENQQLRDYIDGENQSTIDWGPFIPMVSVAKIHRRDAEDDVLDAIWHIGQPVLTFLPPAPVVIDP